MPESPQTPSPPDPTRRYLGLTVEEAKELASREGQVLRVLAPGDLFTMEYLENRINVTVVDDRVVRVRAG